MKKKILYIIGNYTFGGGERGFAQIINGLDRDAYEIYVACLPSGLFVERIKYKAKIIPLDLTKQVNIYNIFRLAEIIRDNNIDIVHSQGPRADFYSRIASRLARHENLPRVVNTIQMPPEGFNVNIFKKIVYVCLDRFTEKFVDRFVTVSGTLQKLMIMTHGISSGKVTRIYNGVEVDEYIDNTEWSKKIRKEFNIKQDTVVIGTIGRLVWQKGLKYFIDAIKVLNEQFIDSNKQIVFLIVGEGSERNNLELQVENLGLKKKVVFTGFREDVKEMLSAFDIFVMSSIREGLPMILLETMAMGKPVIATDIEGINETVVNGETGLLVRPKKPQLLAKAIVSLLNDRNRCKQMGINARKVVKEKFDLNRIIKQYEQLYSKL